MIKGLTKANLGIPNYHRAIDQHESYVCALRNCGLKVRELEADENFPDSTFVEDAALLLEIIAGKDEYDNTVSSRPVPEYSKTEKPDDTDYYTDSERRLMILERDGRKCTYCLVDVAEDSYVLDHIVPVSKGGTNKKFNLVTSCQECNQGKQDEDAIKFLSKNYRAQLISRNEYLKQKDYIENLINQQS